MQNMTDLINPEPSMSRRRDSSPHTPNEVVSKEHRSKMNTPTRQGESPPFQGHMTTSALMSNAQQNREISEQA
jgi:hypothetical protein